MVIRIPMWFCSLPGGQLFEYMCTKAEFDEAEATIYIHQLLTAVNYLHSCQIAHLDIKVSHDDSWCKSTMLTVFPTTA